MPSTTDNEETSAARTSLGRSLARSRRRKKEADPLDPYRKFVAFYTRSQNPFVNYNLALEAGLAWDAGDYGGLTRDQFRRENMDFLVVFQHLCDGIPRFKQDFAQLDPEAGELENLATQLNDAATAARGADISSLKEKGLLYIALEQPGQEITPKLDPSAPKNTSRGHNHPLLSRLLCPAHLVSQFDADPQFPDKLKNNKVKIRADNFPALLYHSEGYDPEDPESGLLRSNILLRFFKHIFTSPSSAKQPLNSRNRVKVKKPQARLNNMKRVTPGSIAYAVLMFRHCISSLEDWRTEDDLFQRDDFFACLLSLFDDTNDPWVKDMYSWWNTMVFGEVSSKSDEDEAEEPSTLDLIRAKREARALQDDGLSTPRHNQTRRYRVPDQNEPEEGQEVDELQPSPLLSHLFSPTIPVDIGSLISPARRPSSVQSPRNDSRSTALPPRVSRQYTSSHSLQTPNLNSSTYRQNRERSRSPHSSRLDRFYANRQTPARFSSGRSPTRSFSRSGSVSPPPRNLGRRYN